MKKVANVFIAMAMATLPSLAQYPTNFAWPAGDAKDQKEQGPCHIFAATAATESWYKILYGSFPDISEAHLYSLCAGANPAPSTTIYDALNFAKNTGVVNEGCLPYTNTNACNDGLSESSYFSIQVANPPLSDCGTPWCNCVSGGTLPSERFRVADWQELSITSFTADDLRRALLNYGPIPLWFYDAGVHPNNHGYLLYGWTGNNAMLKDSWPGAATNNNQSRTLSQIITLFQNNAQFKAYILKSTAQKPGVYRESRTSGSWQDATPALSCIAGPTSLFTINASGNVSYVTNPAINYSISGPFSLYDSPTVTWSYENATGSAAVSFSPSTGTSTSVSYAGGDGTLTIVACIKRPNGVCESYRKTNVRVSPGIPFTISKTYDQCIGSSYRSIEYTASSTISGLNYAWTFYPNGGTTYYTYIYNYPTSSRFVMNLYTLPTGYGLILAVTDPNYPGAQNGSTNGGYAQSCGGWFMAPGDDGPAAESKELTVYPVPATRELSIDANDGELYDLKLINRDGKTVISVTGSKSFNLDVSQVEKGVHLLRLIPRTKSGKAITKRIVVE